MSWFLAFAGFALLVILHELGHFTAAKAVGMRVERFSLFFGPLLLAIGAFILTLVKIGAGDRGIFPNAMPFITLVVIWIAAYFVIRIREQRELRREIDDLREVERENRSCS